MYHPGVMWWTYTHQHKCQYMKFPVRIQGWGFSQFSKVVSNSGHADWNISVQKDQVQKLMNCKILLATKQTVTNRECIFSADKFFASKILVSLKFFQFLKKRNDAVFSLHHYSLIHPAYRENFTKNKHRN